MAGQIIPKGDRRYRLRWFLGRDQAGKRKYGSKNIHGTKKDAEKELRDILGKRDRGILVQSARMPLDTYLNEWLEKAAAGRLRPRTLKDYKDKLNTYVRPILGARRLDRLTPLDIQAMISQLSDKGAPALKKPKPLSPQTVRYAHAVLSGALEQAVRWQMLASNPAKHVQLPKLQRREMASLTPEQAGAFCKALEGTRFEAFFVLLLGTGLRPGRHWHSNGPTLT